MEVVMNKCNWKEVLVDGEPEKYVKTGLRFFPCDKFDGRFLEKDLPDDIDSANYCLYCQTDIRKPEEKPLIVKSGETWVAEWKGINYLCIAPNYDDIEGKMPKWNIEQCFRVAFIEDYSTSAEYRNAWKSFTGDNPDITELTDEIAKSRPMVYVVKDYFQDFFSKLWGVDSDGSSIYYNCGVHAMHRNCRLATAKELQELNE
jgi:hypothetical protein